MFGAVEGDIRSFGLLINGELRNEGCVVYVVGGDRVVSDGGLGGAYEECWSVKAAIERGLCGCFAILNP